MKKSIITLILAMIYLFTMSCEYNRITMPNSDDTTKIFNTGDINYIELNPPWAGFGTLKDIFIGRDDYIFIADSSNKQLVVLNKVGDPVSSDEYGNDFSALQNLPFSPVAVWVDSKLNIFITDNSNKVYVWNQFLNNSQGNESLIDSVAFAIDYKKPNSDEIITVTDFSKSKDLESDGYLKHKVHFEKNQDVIDSLLSVHTFYEDNKEAESKFVSIAASPSKDNALYIADFGEQNIQKIDLVRSVYIKRADGTTLWQHKGQRNRPIATVGTGAGTVNDPSGIFCDQFGDVFYTQTGVNFGLHKIAEVSDDQSLWGSEFALNQHDILDLERFVKPKDVAVDDEGNILVLNTGANEVQVFDNGGAFVRKAGLRTVQVDTTIAGKDTIVTNYYNDVLNDPQAIFVDNGVIYVLNSGDQNILRFKLSSDLDVEIEE